MIVLFFVFEHLSSKFFDVQAVDLRNKIEVEEEKSDSSVVRIYTAGAPGSGVIIGKKGSIHIDNLCKWGPSKISIRKRVFPSGKPKEINKVLKMKDPTWNSEHLFFKKLIEKKLKNNLDNDKYINNTILNIKKHK